MILISLTILIASLAARHAGVSNRENYKLHLCHDFVMYIYGWLPHGYSPVETVLEPTYKLKESLQVLLVGAHT